MVMTLYLIRDFHTPCQIALIGNLGFENISHLQTLHLWTDKGVFPVQSATSIILAIPSRQIQSFTIYHEVKGIGWVHPGGKQRPDILDAYRQLDDALCHPTLKGMKLTLCLCGVDAAKGVNVVRWQQGLRGLLPKFCALEEFSVESTPSTMPEQRWLDHRDDL